MANDVPPDTVIKFAALVAAPLVAAVSLLSNASGKPEHKKYGAYLLFLFAAVVMVFGGLYLSGIGKTWPWETILDLSFSVTFIGFYFYLLIVVRRNGVTIREQEQRIVDADKRVLNAESVANQRVASAETAANALIAEVQRQQQQKCRYLHGPGATTAGMPEVILGARKRLDFLAVTGDGILSAWHSELWKTAPSATAGGWKIRFLLIDTESTMPEQAEAITGSTATIVREQLKLSGKTLKEIKDKFPDGIEFEFLSHRFPPCSMWIADDEVNIESLFCTDRGHGPVFRCEDSNLATKCAKEFQKLWEGAIASRKSKQEAIK